MKLKLVKAAHGLVWVRQGLLACRQQPLGYIGLVGLTSMAVLLLINLLGELGLVLATAMAPAMWMGFMLATRRVLTSQTITPAVMAEAFKGEASPQRELIIVGVLYALALLLAFKIAALIGPDAATLDEIKTKTQDMGELLTNPAIQQSMLLDLLLSLPVTLLFLPTPALILWARVPVAKAVFFGAVSLWRNIGAFIIFGLGWLGVLSAVSLLGAVLLALVPVPLLANVLLIAASMWVSAAVHASLYFTVVDCFEAHRTEASSDKA